LLIPAVNKLGTVPLLLSASEDLKRKCLPLVAVILQNTRIPASRLIGAEGTGFKTPLATLDHTRITIAAQALGIAQGAPDYAAGYVKERRQFGKPVAGFQGVQFMFADMAMKLEGARQLTYHAAAMSERAMAGEKVPRPDVRLGGGQVPGPRHCHGGHHRRGPAARRLRLHSATSPGTDDARCQDHPDLRGHSQIQRVVMARQVLGDRR
jgi:alkylation response protein AidB-like acyl-CoA dehydrogenase